MGNVPFSYTTLSVGHYLAVPSLINHNQYYVLPSVRFAYTLGLGKFHLLDKQISVFLFLSFHMFSVLPMVLNVVW